MKSQFDGIAMLEGTWRGAFHTFAVPAPGAPLGDAGNVRASELVFERPEPDLVRQTNRYPDGRALIWEYRRRGDGVDLTEVQGSTPVPGNPSYMAGLRFFGDGSFTNGLVEPRPGVPLVSEQGFIDGDRKARVLVNYGPDGQWVSATTMCEARGATPQDSAPAPHHLDALLGRWRGEADVMKNDGSRDAIYPSELLLEASGGRVTRTATVAARASSVEGRRDGEIVEFDDGTVLIPLHDRLHVLGPRQVPADGTSGFSLEIGWMPRDDELWRLVRVYDAAGRWFRSRSIIERRV